MPRIQGIYIITNTLTAETYNGTWLHPETRIRGDKHWSHLYPERHRGERNGRARLTEAQVEEIRGRYAAGGVSQFVLADEYSVAQTTISAIVRGKNWKQSLTDFEN